MGPCAWDQLQCHCHGTGHCRVSFFFPLRVSFSDMEFQIAQFKRFPFSDGAPPQQCFMINLDVVNFAMLFLSSCWCLQGTFQQEMAWPADLRYGENKGTFPSVLLQERKILWLEGGCQAGSAFLYLHCQKGPVIAVAWEPPAPAKRMYVS